jgi:hypothetical protein
MRHPCTVYYERGTPALYSYAVGFYGSGVRGGATNGVEPSVVSRAFALLRPHQVTPSPSLFYQLIPIAIDYWTVIDSNLYSLIVLDSIRAK